ncbi:unnamed protein product [Moneuplotes crassus]|uniref:Uncharacterized protein n=1 Tax=Euplotes crassus TaxID=5936 RepID=A0AAD2CXW3_EUPCR|nr:unnamed protein product [Moneuplotes crassus]
MNGLSEVSTYKEDSWSTALKILSKNLFLKLWVQSRVNIKDLIMNTGEEKTDGILPVELPLVFFEAIMFNDLRLIYIQNHSNNDIEEAIEFKTYKIITQKEPMTFEQDLIDFAEEMVQSSGGDNNKTKEKKSDEPEPEAEEDEEELEVDYDGCRVILARFFLNPKIPYYLIPKEDINDRLKQIMQKQFLQEKKKQEKNEENEDKKDKNKQKKSLKKNQSLKKLRSKEAQPLNPQRKPEPEPKVPPREDKEIKETKPKRDLKAYVESKKKEEQKEENKENDEIKVKRISQISKPNFMLKSKLKPKEGIPEEKKEDGTIKESERESTEQDDKNNASNDISIDSKNESIKDNFSIIKPSLKTPLRNRSPVDTPQKQELTENLTIKEDIKAEEKKVASPNEKKSVFELPTDSPKNSNITLANKEGKADQEETKAGLMEYEKKNLAEKFEKEKCNKEANDFFEKEKQSHSQERKEKDKKKQSAENLGKKTKDDVKVIKKTNIKKEDKPDLNSGSSILAKSKILNQPIDPNAPKNASKVARKKSIISIQRSSIDTVEDKTKEKPEEIKSKLKNLHKAKEDVHKTSAIKQALRNNKDQILAKKQEIDDKKRHRSVQPNKIKLKPKVLNKIPDLKGISTCCSLASQEKEKIKKTKIEKQERSIDQMREEINTFLTGERAKAMKEIFSFYCKQHVQGGPSSTFEDVNNKTHSMNLGEFMKFCKDFKIPAEVFWQKKSFLKYSNGSKDLNFDGFKLSSVELFKDHTKEKPTLSKRLQSKVLESKNGKPTLTLEGRSSNRSKSTMRRESIKSIMSIMTPKRKDSATFNSISTNKNTSRVVSKLSNSKILDSLTNTSLKSLNSTLKHHNDGRASETSNAENSKLGEIMDQVKEYANNQNALNKMNDHINLDDKEKYRSKISGFKPKFKPKKAHLVNRLKMLEKAQCTIKRSQAPKKSHASPSTDTSFEKSYQDYKKKKAKDKQDHKIRELIGLPKINR